MDYEDYVKHITVECPKIQLDCPFKCGTGKNSNFEKYQLKDHLASHRCKFFHVYCKDCGEKVLVKDRIFHTCALGKLYQMMKSKVL